MLYSPPSEPISPSVTMCFGTWRWDQLISSDQAAAPGVYRVRVETVDAAPQATSFSADFVLEDPNAGQPITSCPAGCGGLQARANAGGGLDIGYTNLTGQVLDTRVLSYTVERSVEEQWGVVFGPQPVPTSTLTLAPGQSLTWGWQAQDNQEGDAPSGEYRVVLVGTGSAAASGSQEGGITPGTPPRTRTNYYYLGGQRVAMRQGGVGQAGELYYLHVDHLGSTSETTSGTGGRVAQERYYPYGLVRWGSAPTSYNFTGHRLDPSTGLLFYGARYYDPALMRWIQPDTIVPNPGNPQALNRYSYTLNNPLKYIDPSGHVYIIGSTPEYGLLFAGPGCGCNLGTNVYSPEGLTNTWNGVIATASLVVDFVPIVGDAKGLVEVFTGQDLFTGEDLANWRWAGLLGASELRHLGKVDELMDVGRQLPAPKIRGLLTDGARRMSRYTIGEAGVELVAKHLNDPSLLRKVRVYAGTVASQDAYFAELDILTDTAIHEVKNIGNLRLTDTFMQQALKYKLIAEGMGIELHYWLLRSAPEDVVRWLEREGIIVHTGIPNP